MGEETFIDALLPGLLRLGRDFDGGYAEFTSPPIKSVQLLASGGKPPLPWEVLGSLPEMVQTAYGSLFKALQLKAGDKLLIRGGTASVGLAAANLAKAHGAHVYSTTRNSSQSRKDLLLRNGVDQIIIDNGDVANTLPCKMDKVLELIGTVTLKDSLQCVGPGGIVCMSGILGNSWTLDGFNPMEYIPTGAMLTAYAGGPDEFMETPLKDIVEKTAQGLMHFEIGKVMKLEDIVEAHKMMESNQAGGKIVMLP
jgi:NADPH:quinone reductase-like Zn-dependent oxidoreductase